MFDWWSIAAAVVVLVLGFVLVMAGRRVERVGAYWAGALCYTAAVALVMVLVFIVLNGVLPAGAQEEPTTTTESETTTTTGPESTTTVPPETTTTVAPETTTTVAPETTTTLATSTTVAPPPLSGETETAQDVVSDADWRRGQLVALLIFVFVCGVVPVCVALS